MTEKLYTVSLEDLRKAFSDIFAEIKGGPGSGPQGGGGHSGSSGGSSSGHGGDSKPEGEHSAGSTPQHDDKVSDKEAKDVVQYLKDDAKEIGATNEQIDNRDFHTVNGGKPVDGNPTYTAYYTDDKGDPDKEYRGRIDVIRGAETGKFGDLDSYLLGPSSYTYNQVNGT